jgi:hypothetical protein
MADYDFRSLSPHDFELLSRDLLQRSLNAKLESFTSGPDSGIDFRYRTKSDNLIVQCKHYVESGFDPLLRVIKKKERKKLDVLKPTRYVLATSVRLTPANKTELFEGLAPYCLRYEDILGKDDINNLLNQHDDIERKHFKLWLTSETVLTRVLHAGIFSDSDSHLERIRIRLSRYVPNPSFDRAQTLLEKSHFCIVAGIPGIGKTTLAEVLLADLVDRQGFTAFRIAHDLSELRSIKNSKSKQVFYFDDFLGKTALDKLQKNEDQRIVELMEEVANNPNWRFILTTREYILNIAKQQYEAFANPPVDFKLCVINLSDYTWKVRAKILYNHIYFSDLLKEYKLALLEERGYEKILKHHNYNPRVIEYMTRSTHAQGVTPTLYLKEFLDSLDNPTRIWDHAFRHQISEAARTLLFVLATLQDETSLENLEKAFWKFYEFRQRRFGFPTGAGDWIDALKELDGNFIKTGKIGNDVVVSFHNPSIRDFMEKFLATSDSDILDLLRAALFYEQYTGLWRGMHGSRYRGLDQAREEFLSTLTANLWGPSARMIRSVNENGEAVGLLPYQPSKENRAMFLVQVLDELDTRRKEQIVESLLGQLSELWSAGSADKEDLMQLLDTLTKRGLKKHEKPFLAARQCLLLHPETNGEFRAVAHYCEKFPETVSPEELDLLKIKFLEFAEDHPANQDDDPDWIRQVMADLEYVGKRLDVDTERFIDMLAERVDKIETERAEEQPPEDYDDGEWEASLPPVDDVKAMFDGLGNDLRET